MMGEGGIIFVGFEVGGRNDMVCEVVWPGANGYWTVAARFELGTFGVGSQKESRVVLAACCLLVIFMKMLSRREGGRREREI